MVFEKREAVWCEAELSSLREDTMPDVVPSIGCLDLSPCDENSALSHLASISLCQLFRFTQCIGIGLVLPYLWDHCFILWICAGCDELVFSFSHF